MKLKCISSDRGTKWYSFSFGRWNRWVSFYWNFYFPRISQNLRIMWYHMLMFRKWIATRHIISLLEMKGEGVVVDLELSYKSRHEIFTFPNQTRRYFRVASIIELISIVNIFKKESVWARCHHSIALQAELNSR